MPKYKRLNSHKYSINGFEVLKQAAIYGANGSGKSNLVKSISLLKGIVTKGSLPSRLKDKRFKLNNIGKEAPQILSVEFFQDDKAYLYSIEIIDEYIKTEELYLSGLGKSEDSLIFERKTNEKGEHSLSFLPDFENDAESRVLKSVIEKNLLSPEKSLLKLLVSLNNPFLEKANSAFLWFNDSLEIVYPTSKPGGLAHLLEQDKDFNLYANSIMCSFNLGIKNLRTEKKPIQDFFGEESGADIEDWMSKVEESPKKMLTLRSRKGEEVVLVKENEDFWAKQLKLEHTGRNDANAIFDLEEESDGTIRLLDFIPAFRDIITKPKVYIIDEIERSIHPLLIKELVKKFSADQESKGQLIFSTHESNLLDQDVFRQDEIWFVEKKKHGNSELYSLSDFKEHNTIDIRKGYLNGRYGSIPFLANIQDLNWHKHDTEK